MNTQMTANRRKVLFATTIFTAASALGLPMALIPSTANAQPTSMPTLTAQLQQRVLQRRAVEAVIWGMPAVNYDLMLQEMLTKTPGKVGQVIYWGSPARFEESDAHAQSRCTLLHGLLQHQGRPRGARPAGGG